MINILIVTNNLAGGGAEKVLMTFLKNFNRKKICVNLFLIQNFGVYINEIPSDINCRYLLKADIDTLLKTSSYHELKKLYMKNIKKEYDYEVAFLEGPAVKFLANSTNKNSIKYAWVHTDIQNAPWTLICFVSREEEYAAFDRFNKIFCVSEGVRSIMVKLFPNLEKKLAVILNNIDKNEILYNSLAEKIKYNIITFCCIARLSDVKGHMRLLEAMKNLLELGYDFNLELLGEGKTRKKIEQFIEQNKLHKNVKLHGFIKNPYPHIKAADAVILTSFAEGYPTVLCEAMVLEVPVIATDCIGVRDVLGNGKYGLIVENSLSGITTALEKVLVNPSILKKLAKKAKKGSDTFGLSISLPAYEQLFVEDTSCC
jgi:glycosyltransferase involved in cell wall biosynthesis